MCMHCFCCMCVCECVVCAHRMWCIACWGAEFAEIAATCAHFSVIPARKWAAPSLNRAMVWPSWWDRDRSYH